MVWFRILILFFNKRENLFWEPTRVLTDNLICAIGRGIVVNENLNGEGRFLHQESFQAFPNKRSMIVCHAANADKRQAIHQ